MKPNFLASTLLKKIWKSIDNPKSGCPDVELGQVLGVMVDALVESEELPDCGSLAANWALAYITIEGKTDSANLRAGWSDKVPRFTGERDEMGYRKEIPVEEYEGNLLKHDLKMVKALQCLFAKGVLIKDGKNIWTVK